LRAKIYTGLILFIGAFSVILFISPVAHGLTLPAQCPGVIGNYNVIQGTAGDETLRGTAGNDFIFGDGGNDTIIGGGGNDCISADSGTDNITTGSGDDVILVGGDNNIIKAGEGDNFVISGSGRDNIVTGGGNDTIIAGDGNNAIRSGPGDDTITTGSGNDYINAGGGADSCFAGTGRNILSSCESGNETPAEQPSDDNQDNQDNQPDPNGNNGSDNDNSGGSPNNGTDNNNQDNGTPANNDNETPPAEDNTTPGPTVGNGIVLGMGGGVPPISVRDEKISSPAPGRVIVSWKTNIPSTSQVVYGINSQDSPDNPPDYGYASATPEDIYLTTDHRVEINNLDSSKKYFLRPVSDVMNSTEGIGIELIKDSVVPTAANESLALNLAPINQESSDTASAAPNKKDTTSPKNSLDAEEIHSPDGRDATTTDKATSTNEEIALLFGVIPMTSSQFFLIILVIFVFAITIWWSRARRRK